MHIQEAPLRAYVAEILAAAGSPQDEAETVAEHLVGANLRGHDSHGVGMLLFYLEHLRIGALHPGRTPRLTADRGAILQFDGQRGYGAPAGRRAMAAAIDRARELGICAVTLGGVQHLGRIGGFGEQAMAAGFISLHFVSVNDHAGLAAPYGGTDARYGTNPVCVAVPGFGAQDDFLLDFATTKIAVGKARVAMMRGEPLEEGLVLDPAGRPSTDPSVMFAKPIGALLPLAEYKGYGLAFACELLSGVLSGLGTIQPGNERREGIGNAMLAIVLDPAKFGDPAWIAAEIKATTEHFRASPPDPETGPVRMPGDPERETMAQRRAEGIFIEDATWTAIAAEAEKLGVTAP